MAEAAAAEPLQSGRSSKHQDSHHEVSHLHRPFLSVIRSQSYHKSAKSKKQSFSCSRLNWVYISSSFYLPSNLSSQIKRSVKSHNLFSLFKRLLYMGIRLMDYPCPRYAVEPRYHPAKKWLLLKVPENADVEIVSRSRSFS